MSGNVTDLIQFLNESTTPYHAVAVAINRLKHAGFTPLDEADAWQVETGGRYFFTRRDASVVAFIMGNTPVENAGMRIVGAHTDSPTLKVKPRPERNNLGYAQVGVEMYGGVLLHPWFDRNLSLAGRVTVRHGVTLKNYLVDFRKPLAVIPSLAIHLDRTVNEGRAVNPEEHIRPVFTQESPFSIRHLVSEQLARQQVMIPPTDVLEYDLNFYDIQPACQTGLCDEFVSGARLDNLLSCHGGLQAFIATADEDCLSTRVLALFDHEEVGSTSDIGANSNMLPNLFERLTGSVESRHRAVARSTLLSVDGAHGIHPNYPQKHDQSHGPRLNQGPVIKTDANQSYATSSTTASLMHLLAAEAQIPLQSFVTRADMRCGSTIGPMSAAKLGIATADLGLAMFAMHSIREMAGARDVDYLDALLRAFFKT